MKKGLVLVYDPHNLLQFIWYYCTYGKDKKWDALCLPNAHKGEYMSKYCEKSGVFENIIKDDKSFLNSSMLEQFKLFAKMTFNAVLHRQKKFCEKVLNTYVNLDDYDEIVVLTDVGLLSGFCLSQAKEKNVIILEDGVGDYVIRSYSNLRKNLRNPADWKGYFLSNMGYSNVGHRYPLKTTKDCIKFSSHPESMQYQDYKEHKLIFDFSTTDMRLYNSAIEHIYTQLKNYDFNKYDTILFTSYLGDYVNDPSDYKKRLENYISKITDSLLIKKHPRDSIDFNFAENVDVREIPQSIPAEVILPYIKGKNVVFMQITSILLYMNSKDYNCKCVYFDGLYEHSSREIATFGCYFSKEELLKKLKEFKFKDIELLNI